MKSFKESLRKALFVCILFFTVSPSFANSPSISSTAATAKLAGKHAFITGGSSGIGLALVKAFAEEGAEVVFTYHSKEVEAGSLVKELGERGYAAHAVKMNLSDKASVDAAVSEALRLCPSIEILVNNAAILVNRAFLDTSLDDFQSLLQTNVTTPFYISQIMAKHMIDQGIKGNILHIGSFRGTKPIARLFAYSMSKAALYSMNSMMAAELAPHGIRVNLIAPGGTLTDMSRKIYDTQAKVEERGKRVPLGRYGQPEDHTAAAVYLVSDAASWTTGAVLTIDGGESTER